MHKLDICDFSQDTHGQSNFYINSELDRTIIVRRIIVVFLMNATE